MSRKKPTCAQKRARREGRALMKKLGLPPSGENTINAASSWGGFWFVAMNLKQKRSCCLCDKDLEYGHLSTHGTRTDNAGFGVWVPMGFCTECLIAALMRSKDMPEYKFPHGTYASNRMFVNELREEAGLPFFPPNQKKGE